MDPLTMEAVRKEIENVRKEWEHIEAATQVLDDLKERLGL